MPEVSGFRPRIHSRLCWIFELFRQNVKFRERSHIYGILLFDYVREGEHSGVMKPLYSDTMDNVAHFHSHIWRSAHSEEGKPDELGQSAYLSVSPFNLEPDVGFYLLVVLQDQFRKLPLGSSKFSVSLNDILKLSFGPTTGKSSAKQPHDRSDSAFHSVPRQAFLHVSPHMTPERPNFLLITGNPISKHKKGSGLLIFFLSAQGIKLEFHKHRRLGTVQASQQWFCKYV